MEPTIQRLVALQREERPLRQGLQIELGAIWKTQTLDREKVAEAIEMTLEDTRELTEKVLQEMESVHKNHSEDRRHELDRWVENRDGTRRGGSSDGNFMLEEACDSHPDLS